MREMLTPKKSKVGTGPDGEGLKLHARGTGRTMTAADAQGYCAYDKTSISFHNSGLERV